MRVQTACTVCLLLCVESVAVGPCCVVVQSLERQVKGVMGTRPAAHRFAHPADDGQFVGVGTRCDGREGWSRGKSGLEGAAALATATHLPPADEEGEHGKSRLRRGEASFGENVPRRTG